MRTATKPRTTVMHDTKPNAYETNATTAKKKGFRIKRNKNIKKRLFSANTRDEVPT